MSAALAFALCSCSDDDEAGESFATKVFNVMGKVEKRPMICGSHVEMRTLDEYMVPNTRGKAAAIVAIKQQGDKNYWGYTIPSDWKTGEKVLVYIQ